MKSPIISVDFLEDVDQFICDNITCLYTLELEMEFVPSTHFGCDDGMHQVIHIHIPRIILKLLICSRYQCTHTIFVMCHERTFSTKNDLSTYTHKRWRIELQAGGP